MLNNKEDIYDKININMSHDELITALGKEAWQKIVDAGFVLVPKQWRENVFKALAKKDDKC
jgi:hypothetical protein